MGCSGSHLSNQQTFKQRVSLTAMDLPTGQKMPFIGYGTWMASGDVLETALDAALEAGYRHIDTAAAYMNEAIIGKVLKRWFDSGKLRRDELFITTKLPPTGNRASDVEKFIDKSLNDLQLDYLDLYLVHVPFTLKGGDSLLPVDENGFAILDTSTDHIAVWKAMEAQFDAGKTKAIGISNFNEKQIGRILANCRVPPANLQIEIHLYLQQTKLVDFCKDNNITITAYSPLGSPGNKKLLNTENKESVLDNKLVAELAERHNKSAAQIALRFLVQQGIATIPKSVNPKRIKENIDVFNFELTEEELEQLRGLDIGEPARVVTFDFFKGLKENHPEYPF